MGQPICQVSPRGSGSVLETPESALLWAPEAQAVVALGDQMLGLWLLGAQRGDIQVQGGRCQAPSVQTEPAGDRCQQAWPRPEEAPVVRETSPSPALLLRPCCRSGSWGLCVP